MRKRLFVLALAAILISTAAGEVWVSVYQHDGKTPLAAVDATHSNVYRDIMAGTRLTLVIRSDSSAYFAGRLRLSWDDAPYARLSGRGLTPPPPGSAVKFSTYKDSALNAAGTQAYVRDAEDSQGIGLYLSSDHKPYTIGGHAAYPGNWFVVDYHAERAGVCHVTLYNVAGNANVLLQTLSFTHVPARDFNRDSVVNFTDFAHLASHWHSAGSPGSGPTAALDLHADGRIDFADLAAFSRFWLEQIDSAVTPAPVKVFNEGWESAAPQVYPPGSTSHSDAGSWLVGDTISLFGGACGVSPQRAEIVADNGNHFLQLRSVESFSDCDDDVSVSLREINGTNIELNIPLTVDTVLSFQELGELTDPPWQGSGPDCRFPPCFASISLILRDNNGNALAYVLQRSPGAVANAPNARFPDTYREVFLDPAAGSYRRDLFADFQTIPAFYPVRAKITYIAFRVNQHGWAILDDLVIGPPAPADPNSR